MLSCLRIAFRGKQNRMWRSKTASALATFVSGLIILFSMQPGAQAAPVPHIEITPSSAFVGENVKIVLRGFAKNQLVSVRAWTTNTLGQVWAAHAEFRTDRHGRVDLATQAPLSGTYRHADASGLFWSMSLPAGEKVMAESIRKPFKSKPTTIEFSATVNDEIVATVVMQRALLAPGVKRIPVHEDGLRGILFVPPGRKPHPSIIVLGGSEGGLPEISAAYLASKGYITLALAYFGYEDLPQSLENIRLEYFETAIRWLKARQEVQRNSIAVIGASRGAELALLLGATFPGIRAVVAFAPSSVIWPGISTMPNGPGVPAWTYQGRPLPFMTNQLNPEQKKEIAQLPQTTLVALTPEIQIMLGDKASVDRASIPVEKINGPVLLISANDDQLCPSTEMADMVMKRLKAMKHAFPDRHLAYSDVGHFIPIPNMTATVHDCLISDPKMDLALGGDTEHTAAAARDSWAHVVKFLNAAFRKSP